MLYLIILLVIIFLSYKLINKHTHDIDINRLDIKNEKIKNKIKILHLSDLHFNFNKKYQKKLVKVINELDYDMLVFTGDYLNGDEYLINLEQFFKNIAKKDNVFLVLGNNDQKFKMNIYDIFKNKDIKLLINDGKHLVINGNDVNIIGIDTPDLDKDDYNKAVQNINLNNCYNLLLSHTYHITEKEKLNNIDLVLVGDTHGGQINLPIVNDIANKRFELKYKSGLYNIGEMLLYVNKGIGTNFLPFRVNCKPEMVLITIG